jgi:hypothetical protein
MLPAVQGTLSPQPIGQRGVVATSAGFPIRMRELGNLFVRGHMPHQHRVFRPNSRPVDMRRGLLSCRIEHKSSRTILYIKPGAPGEICMQNFVLN